MAENKNQKKTSFNEAVTGVSGQNIQGPPAKDIDEAMARIRRADVEKSVRAKARTANLTYVDIAHMPINTELLYLMDLKEAEKALTLPFFRVGKKLRLAVFDQDSEETKKFLSNLRAEGYLLNINLASREGILEAIGLYRQAKAVNKEAPPPVVNEAEIEAYQKEIETLAQMKNKIETGSSEEALSILNVGAIKTNASDIHFQPEEDKILVRFRIDGVLQNVLILERKAFENIRTQLKYKSGMRLNVVSKPQDGRYSFAINNRKIDVRVSSLPSELGESFVCRYLDSGRHFLDLAELGFTGTALEKLKQSSRIRNGMILVTGPTGSGKTTTLYALLKSFNKPEVKIITLENPIEYNLANISQSQIDEKEGYTFPVGLRAILRQNPDIVMIGEIRDLKTAEVAAQAALTGHVLLSTLHTNSAIETIPRLINMGLPTFMIAPALDTVIAQRLVRKICSNCGVLKKLTPVERKEIEKYAHETKIPEEIYHPAGCDKCSHMGYTGQVAIAEVFTVTDEFRDAILDNRSASELFAIARKQGMTTLKEDGISKVIAGLTTLEEVERVTGMEESEIEIATSAVETKDLEIGVVHEVPEGTKMKKLPPEKA